MAFGLFVLLCLFRPISLGTLKSVIGFAHPRLLAAGCRAFARSAKDSSRLGLALDRPLWTAIQAAAEATESKLPTVAGLATEMETFSPKLPLVSGIAS
jgi:hypothetical protein